MAAYYVKRNGPIKVGGVDVVLCVAADEATAIALAEATDGLPWSDATVTNVTSLSSVWADQTVRVSMYDPDGRKRFSVEVTGQASLTAVGNALRDALKKVSGLSNPAYSSGTRMLTVSRAADLLGDRSVKVEWFLAGCPGGSLPSMVSAIIHQGAASSETRVTFQPTTPPRIFKRLRIR